MPPDTSGFTVQEWELLHQYERTFGVREAVMSGSPTDVSSALDYGLTEVFADRGIVGEWVGPAGQTVFEYVNVDNPIEISDYAVASLPTGSGSPLGSLGGDRKGTNGVSTDGVTAISMFFENVV